MAARLYEVAHDASSREGAESTIDMTIAQKKGDIH